MDIFPYNDGTKNRFGDPMRIERILESHCGGSLYTMLQQAKSENPDIANPSTDQILAAVCKAFELAPFDPLNGKGTTEEFQVALLDKFGEWRSKKNGTTESPPNSHTPTDGEPPSGQRPSQTEQVQPKFNTVSGSISP